MLGGTFIKILLNTLVNIGVVDV